MKTALLIPEKKCSRNSPPDHLACPLGLGHPEAQPLLLPFLPWVILGLSGQGPKAGEVHSQSMQREHRQPWLLRPGKALAVKV